jgi:aminopeptidase N
VIRSNYDAVAKKQKVQIKQVQDFSKTPLFRLPMDIDIYSGKSAAVRHHIMVTKAEETFEFDVNENPELVNVDAQKMLLCTKDEQKTPVEWAFQYKNGPLFLDRYEALTELAQKSKDSISTQIIILALNDKLDDMRYNAITMLKDIQPGYEKQVKEKIVALAKTDPKAMVRAAAIDYLVEHYSDSDLQPLYKAGLNDRSYGVIGSSLAGITKADPSEGMRIAKQYENEKSVSVLYSIADLYSKYGSDDNNDFFIKAEDRFNGFDKIGYITQYAAFLKRVKKDETVNSGVIILERIAKDESISKWVAYYAKKSIKDLATIYEDRESLASQKLKTIREANPSAGGTQELESIMVNSKAQKEKLLGIYNGLK